MTLPKQPHHDIIHEIRRKLADSRLTWKFRHVDGHQDKHNLYHLLDMWEELNVEMDSLAKVYWNDSKPSVLPFYPPSPYGWSIWLVHANSHPGTVSLCIIMLNQHPSGSAGAKVAIFPII
jgi:hypothetical protein